MKVIKPSAQIQSDGSTLLCRDDGLTYQLEKRYADRIQNEKPE